MITATATYNHLWEKKNELAIYITEALFDKHPQLATKWGALGKEKCLQDTHYHLIYLMESIRFETPEIFNSYLQWAQIMLGARNVPVEDLVSNVNFISEACNKILPSEIFHEVEIYLNKGLNKIQNHLQHQSTYLSIENPLSNKAKNYLELLLQGNRKSAGKIISDLLEDGVPVTDIYNHIFKATQYEIGLLWQTNKITVAHEHFCTAATQTIISSLYQNIFSHTVKKGKILACTVSGDLHELGIRLLSDEFEMKGWDTYYMGANMPDANILSAAVEQKADVLAVSVTMPFHLKKLEELIVKIRKHESLTNLKILVGGYPFNLAPQLSQKVGADASATTTDEAISIATKMMSLN